MAEFLKGFGIFFMCTFYFGKAGVPAAIMHYGHDFLTIFLVCTSGGIVGNFVFTYLSAWILKKIHHYRAKKNLIHKKPIFTKFNRIVVKIKSRFGLAGIAFITPMFLSIPVGAFLAERFYRKKLKIVLYLSISVIFWETVLYLIYLMF